MNFVEKIFKNKTCSFSKLKEYGFEFFNDKFTFSAQLCDNQFTLYVYILSSGEISTEVIDNNFNEEYSLHLVDYATGEFVTRVRNEYEGLLQDISNKCFVKQVFKSLQAMEIISYINNKYNDSLEFLWEKFDDNAIVRRKDNRKWYCVFMKISRKKLGQESDEIVEIIDVRCNTNIIQGIVDYKSYFPAYHMNKKHWITILFDNSLDNNKIKEFIDNSFNLAGTKK